MKWRLGLDMGTGSIGWAAVLLKDKTPAELLDMDVRIFPDGREPAGEGRTGDPLNERRRTARQMRRQRDRRIRRKKAMLRYLIASGYLPADKTERKRIEKLDPYSLRSEAVSHVLKKEELARILMQLTSRRGFKSNREDQTGTQDEEKAGMLAGIARLSELLGEKTLGQWMYEEHQKKNVLRFRPEVVKSKINYAFYPSRAMYEAEFEAIRKVQGSAHSGLDWDKLCRIIYFQRPLKRPERGRCQFYPEEVRGYRALPSAHRFRILQEINNLKYFDENNRLVEIAEQFKSLIYDLLNQQKTVAFEKMRKEFSRIIGESFTSPFNLENSKRSSLKGNETSYDLRNKALFGEQWDQLDWETQDKIVETLIVEEDEEKILKLLDNYSLSNNQKDNILKWEYSRGTTMLSARFMRECSTIMLEHFVPYHEAVAKMGMHHSDFEKIVQRSSLPYYGEILTSLTAKASGDQNDPDEIRYGRISNPTVHIALNQLRKLVNALIRRYGKPSEIIVEIGRNLKISPKTKLSIFQQQALNQENNNRARNELTKLGLVHPTGEFIKKYRLWEELAPGGEGLVRRCPYCGKPISASQLLSADVEIEHILPYSRTLLDSRDNLTIAHKICNQVKKERTPYEAFGHSPLGFDWETIMELSQKFYPQKRIKFSPQAMAHFDEENGGFIQQQLTDNAYIAKAGKNYLSTICDRDSIWTISGMLTAKLRGQWGINTLLNASHDTWYKNRSDHRHHALDAVVIALCDRSIIAATSRMNQTLGYAGITVPPCPLRRDDIENELKKIVVSIKPDHGPEGRLYAETAMGAIKVLMRISPNKLNEKDIPHINTFKIREYAMRLLQEKKSVLGDNAFKAVKKILQERYKYFDVLRIKWATTAALQSLSERDVESIVDSRLREDILRYIREKSEGRKLTVVLQEYADAHKMRSVRYCSKGQVPVSIASTLNKFYLPYDFYRVDIWILPDKKKEYKGVFISRAEYYRQDKLAPREPIEKPHPAAKFVMTLYKNDIVEISSANVKELCRIAGYSTTVNAIDIRPIAATDSIADWLRDTNSELTSLFWPRDCTGQNFKSINMLFNTYAVRLVNVSVDGRLNAR